MRLRSSLRSFPRPSPRAVVRTLRLAARAPVSWPPVRWLVALGGAVGCVLLVGVPTAVVPTPLFTRAVPTQWWNYPVLLATALLGGLLLATYVRRSGGDGAGRGRVGNEQADGQADGQAGDAGADRRPGRLGTAGGILTFFAVGCPVCNKLVLLLLGTSGALTIWQPLQPVLACVSLALLGVAAVRRLAGEAACPVRRPAGAV